MGLFNSTVLEVVIGLIFVYLLLSVLCTAANEWISAITRRRGEMLRKGIRQLLEGQNIPGKKDGETFLSEFYEHPLIKSIKHDENHPNYISPRTFTAVVTDILTAATPGVISFGDLETGGKDLPLGPVKTSVLALVQRSNGDLEKAQNAIEGWFYDSMDRVNGWYKRRTQIWTLLIALLLTLVANADTIHIVRQLGSDPVLRAAVMEEAKVRAQKPRPTISVEYKDEDDPTNPTVTPANEGNQLSDKERDLLGQMLGWHDNVFKNKDGNGWGMNVWFQRLIGWLLTILALSLGAPFWFDMLNKVMNVRFAGKSPDETSKGPDKQDAKARA
jgi:hypothetical protein